MDQSSKSVDNSLKVQALLRAYFHFYCEIMELNVSSESALHYILSDLPLPSDESFQENLISELKQFKTLVSQKAINPQQLFLQYLTQFCQEQARAYMIKQFDFDSLSMIPLDKDFDTFDESISDFIDNIEHNKAQKTIRIKYKQLRTKLKAPEMIHQKEMNSSPRQEYIDFEEAVIIFKQKIEKILKVANIDNETSDFIMTRIFNIPRKNEQRPYLSTPSHQLEKNLTQEMRQSEIYKTLAIKTIQEIDLIGQNLIKDTITVENVKTKTIKIFLIFSLQQYIKKSIKFDEKSQMLLTKAHRIPKQKQISQNLLIFNFSQRKVSFRKTIHILKIPLGIQIKLLIPFFHFQLKAARSIEIQIKQNGKLINNDVCIEDIDVEGQISIYQIIHFKLDNSQSEADSPLSLCGRSSDNIDYLKQKFALEIGLQPHSQEWTIEERKISNQTLDQLLKQYGEQELYFILESKQHLQCYGFSKLKNITLAQFKSFSLQDQEYFRQQLAKNENPQFPMKQYEDRFRQLCLQFIFSMIKKNCHIKHALTIIKDITKQYLHGARLWIPQDDKKPITFNDTYIIYNLLNSADKKLRIELLRKLKINYPVPLILLREGKQVQLFEEHFWIHNEAFNIASMTYGNKKIMGKSLLLNQIFNTSFISRQQCHEKCSRNVQISYNILKSTDFNVNIIDVCNQIVEKDKQWIIKSANFIIFHSKFSAPKLSQQQKKSQSIELRNKIEKQLKSKNIAKRFLIIFRDSNRNQILNQFGDISLQQMSKELIERQQGQLKNITSKVYQILHYIFLETGDEMTSNISK